MVFIGGSVRKQQREREATIKVEKFEFGVGDILNARLAARGLPPICPSTIRIIGKEIKKNR